MRYQERHTAISYVIGILAFAIIVVGCSANESGSTENGSNVIKEGSVVKAHYTLTVQGEEVDSSRDGTPLQFQVGLSQLIPGFEKSLMGMKAGEKKSFEVTPEDAYGPVNPEAIKEIPKDRLAPDIKPEIGMTLYAKGPNGENIPVKIAEIREKSMVIDFNHPLAGKTLHFDVEIVDVQ